jgi:serine protease Do
MVVTVPLYAQPESLSESDLANASYIDIGNEAFQLTNSFYEVKASSETAGQATVEMTDTVAYGDLANLTLPLDLLESGVVTLTDGVFEDGELNATLSTYVEAGDLNGDGTDDAAAIVIANPTGTANFYYLYALLDEEGTLTPLVPILLDDRAEIHDLLIDNGEIVVAATVHGPEDADCCPTQLVERRYGVQGDALNLLDEQLVETVLYGAAGIVPGGTFDPDTDGAAVLNLGGTDNGWLDPSLVSVLSGVATGPAVDAQTLAKGCVGYIAERPDVVLNWTEDTNVEALRFFVLGLGDPVMVVVTPSGEIVCNDDYTPLVSDPYIEIADPEEGRYAIFVGSFEDSAVRPGFVVVTSQDSNPAMLDLNHLFPRQANAALLRTPISRTAILVDAAAQVTPSAPLTTTELPYSTTLTAGGSLGAFNVELGNSLCTGFISGAPTFAFEWSGEADQITLAFEAAADTTLIVRDPNGSFQCNDDFHGSTNLNPVLTLTPIDGHYLVWVGSYAPDVTLDGVLTIGEGAIEPTPLTADSMQQ